MVKSVLVWAVFAQFYVGATPVEKLTGAREGYQAHRTFNSCETERKSWNEVYGENRPDDKDAINYVCKPLALKK